mgnify:CR=1 FL=1
MTALPDLWPNWKQKLATWQQLDVTLFPSQERASRALTGRRDLPRTVQVIGGERAGKSQWAAHEVTVHALWPGQLIYLAGAKYENCEPEYDYVESNLRQLGALASSSRPKNGQWQMTTSTGCEIQTISLAQGSDALIATGRAPDLVVLCEAGMLEHDNFLAAYTRVGERRGAVIAVGTLKRSRPWYVALYRQLQAANPYRGKSFSFPSWENTSIYPGGRSDPVIVALEAALGPQRFMERIGAEPVPSPLLVFGREFDYALHVQRLAYDPDLPLWLACDPGYAGAYALLVGQAASASDVRVLAEFYQQYATWDRAVAWLRALEYVEAEEPDDAGVGAIYNVDRAVMDIAGKQHHADRSQIEQWHDATGIKFRSNPVGIDLGIARLRDFLRSPFAWDVTRLHIDPSCEGLLWELAEGEQYPRDQEGNPVKEAPVDANNHSRKALSYLLVDAFGKSDNWQPAQSVPGHDRFATVKEPQGAAGVDLVRDESGGLRFVHSRASSRRSRALGFGSR